MQYNAIHKFAGTLDNIVTQYSSVRTDVSHRYMYASLGYDLFSYNSFPYPANILLNWFIIVCADHSSIIKQYCALVLHWCHR